jgi:hypothetical protein
MDSFPESRRRPGLSVLMLLLLVPTAACSLHVRDSEMVGTYKATAEWGTSTIVLKPDHTFTQSVSTKTGAYREVQGNWELDQSGLTDAITFTHKYLSVTHNEQGEEAGGAFASVDPRLFGGIEISADPDYGVAFVKQ